VAEVSTEDVVAIQQLMALYGHVADDGDLDRLAEVFTEDGVFDLTAMTGEVHRGLAGIRAFFALGAPPHPPSHHTTNVLVVADGETVRVRSKWMTIDRASGGMKTGDYADVVVRERWRWLIRERVATARWFRGELVRLTAPSSTPPGGEP
jgi:uncharacterized protein (TIGR02246 family)